MLIILCLYLVALWAVFPKFKLVRWSCLTTEAVLSGLEHPRRARQKCQIEGLSYAISPHGFGYPRGYPVGVIRRGTRTDRRIRVSRSRIGRPSGLCAPGLVATPAKRCARASAAGWSRASTGRLVAAAAGLHSRETKKRQDNQKSHDEQPRSAEATAIRPRSAKGNADHQPRLEIIHPLRCGKRRTAA